MSLSTEESRGVIESTKGDRLIGRNKEGDRIYLSVELRHKRATPGSSFETVEHEFLSEYVELGMMGLVVPKHCRIAYGAGQIIDELLNMDGVAVAGISFKRIHDLWKRCHLNGLKGECIHQDPGAHVSPGGGWLTGEAWDAVIAEQTALCPEGYKYGSKWLVEPLAERDREFANTLIGKLRGLPRYDGD